MYNRYNVWYSDAPPPYNTLAKNCPKNSDPPPSYSSLDLTDLPPLESPTAAGLHHPLVQTTIPTLQTGVQVPTYMLWSSISTLLFCPLGFVALIFTLKVTFAMQNNDAGSAWKSHMIARRINIAATLMGVVLALYYAFTIPLMNHSRNIPLTNTTHASA